VNTRNTAGTEVFRPFIDKYPALALIGNTALVRIEVEELRRGCGSIWAKAEWVNPGGSIKDRPVMRMLLEAMRSGELTEDKVILDSSSGNAGIAYAMIGAMLGRRVELVVPGNASLERKRRILAHGANLVQTDPLEGYDAALHEAHRRLDADPERYYMPDQYANDNNWRAHYYSTADEILQQTGGQLTHFVAGVGTGGTITGVGRRLKEHDPKIQIVGVKPDAFPGIEGLKPLERPEDIVPKILDRSVIDYQIDVTTEDAYDYCHKLALQGLFLGQSSGAYLKAACDVARGDPRAKVVTVFSDLGERYFSTGLWG
jgi:cysteine synthase B